MSRDAYSREGRSIWTLVWVNQHGQSYSTSLLPSSRLVHAHVSMCNDLVSEALTKISRMIL